MVKRLEFCGRAVLTDTNTTPAILKRQAWAYDPAGNRTVTPRRRSPTYTYNLDDSLASTGFTNETIATADLSHTYDTQYARPATLPHKQTPSCLRVLVN